MPKIEPLDIDTKTHARYPSDYQLWQAVHALTAKVNELIEVVNRTEPRAGER